MQNNIEYVYPKNPSSLDCLWFHLGMCTTRADIVFVVDASGSIGPANWEITIDVIQQLVNLLQIGPDAVQVGFVRFNETATTQFRLNQFRDAQSVNAAVSRVVYTGGMTNLAGGLRQARVDLFQEFNGDRPNAPNMVIVLTDGRPDTEISNTVREADLLKSAGADIITVGVTGNVDGPQLMQIASNPRATLFVNDFSRLQAEVQRIADLTCDVINEGIQTAKTSR